MLANFARVMTHKNAIFFSLLIMLLVLGHNVVMQAPELMAANFSNPDSYQKLLLVRDHDPELGFNFVARDNAPHGFWMHWSVPHTWTVWMLHKGLLFIGVEQQAALLVAGSSLTLLSMLLLALFVTLAVANAGSSKAALLAGLAVATNPPLHGYGQLLQITHHIFMLVPVAAAAACFLRPSFRPMPWVDFTGGLLLGFALWVSPETMPFVIALAGLRAAIRLQHAASGPVWPVAFGLMLMLLTGWYIDPPAPTFTAWALDHISYAWLLLGALLAVLLCLVDLSIARALSMSKAVALLTAAFLLGVTCWLWLVPGVLKGADGLISPYLHKVWYSHIQELQPVTKLSEVIAFLILPIIAGCVLLVIAWRERSLWMLVLALAALAYAALISNHVRMGAAGATFAILAFGVAISRVRSFEYMHDEKLPITSQLYAALLILVVPLHVLGAMGASYFEQNNIAVSENEKACHFDTVLTLLSALPPGVVLAESNLGPAILFKTHHQVVAGNYHHNQDGLIDNFRMLRDVYPDTEARALVVQRGVDYMVSCSKFKQELITSKSDNHQTLAQRMAAGKTISWLPRSIEIEGWWVYFVK